jgi:beta-glucanase (GH16 family)
VVSFRGTVKSGRVLASIMLLAGALASCSVAGEHGSHKSQLPTKADTSEAKFSPRWVLTWSDSFDTVSDLKHWTVFQGIDTSDGQLELYSSNNVSVSKSNHLVITADRIKPHNTCWYGHCEYTSGRIQTLGLFAQKYGRFEARIKLPAGPGLWPAFWMAGANEAEVGFPACGEIDIIEKNGQRPNQVEGVAHAPNRNFGAYYLLPHPLSSEYHTYGVDWTPSGINWFIDGHTYSHMNAYPGWPFAHPFFIIIDLAVGGHWAGAPTAATPFPAHMDIAWMKIYRAVVTAGKN